MLRPILLLCASLALLGDSPAAVNVAYAGSLVTPMERTVGPAFSAACRCEFRGEARGSVALGRLIAAGAKNPDVFITADTAVSAPQLGRYTVFASARMVLGYSARSRYAAQIARARRGAITLAQLLETPGLRIGRTDPLLDPKGKRTLVALRRLSAHFHDGRLALLARDAPVFPEEDLLVRLESGDVDVAFLYSTEARSRELPALELPADSNLSDTIRYAVAVLRTARNPDGARAFVAFILHGPGRKLLQAAGLQYR